MLAEKAVRALACLLAAVVVLLQVDSDRSCPCVLSWGDHNNDL